MNEKVTLDEIEVEQGSYIPLTIGPMDRIEVHEIPSPPGVEADTTFVDMMISSIDRENRTANTRTVKHVNEYRRELAVDEITSSLLKIARLIETSGKFTVYRGWGRDRNL